MVVGPAPPLMPLSSLLREVFAVTLASCTGPVLAGSRRNAWHAACAARETVDARAAAWRALEGMADRAGGGERSGVTAAAELGSGA